MSLIVTYVSAQGQVKLHTCLYRCLVFIHVVSWSRVCDESSVPSLCDCLPQRDVCVSMFVKSYLVKAGWTPLFVAAKNGHLNVVKCLMKETKVNPDKTHMV